MRFCDFSNILHKNIKIRTRKFVCKLETILSINYQHIYLSYFS